MGNCEGFVHKLTAVGGNNRNGGHHSPVSSANAAKQILSGENHGASVIRVEPGRNPQVSLRIIKIIPMDGVLNALKQATTGEI